MQSTKSLLIKLLVLQILWSYGRRTEQTVFNYNLLLFPSMINIPFRLVGNRSKRMSHQAASAYKTVVFFGTRLRREIPDHTLWSYHDSTL